MFFYPLGFFKWKLVKFDVIYFLSTAKVAKFFAKNAKKPF